jgi:trimethylamine--corrinoid protein Co-methyltransferase
MFSIAGASESKSADLQAAAEAALSLVVESLAGGNIIHDLGYLESGLTFSFIQLALCDEITSWIKGFMKRFEVSDEALALDVIEKMGPDGQYLGTKHTKDHYRERWYPGLFERADYGTWLKNGGKDFSERARVKIDKILGEHKPAPLPPDIQARIQEIAHRARRST